MKKKNPTHKYSEAVGVFYWGLGKGKRKDRHHSGEKLVCGPKFFKEQGLNIGCGWALHSIT